jgi:hypothetical protein
MPDALPNPERGYDQNPAIAPYLPESLWNELCIRPPWENRLYPSGEMESGLNDHSANVTAENFEGGTFSYQWPPGTTTGVLLVADLSTYQFSWTITSPSSSYYPGRHSGIIKMPRISSYTSYHPYPLKPPIPIWKTPILCPFIKPGIGSLSNAYGYWDDIWSPAYRLDTFTTSFAEFLHYGPLYEGMPDGQLGLAFRYHPFNPGVDDPLYMTHEPWFRLATNFFCRAYTLEDGGGDEEDSTATDDMRLNSIQSIKGLLENTSGHPGISVSPGESLVCYQLTVDQSFSADRIRTRRQWIEEEKVWADLLARIYGVKMT